MITNIQEGPSGVVDPVNVISVLKLRCPYCHRTFHVGEEYTLIPRVPTDPEARQQLEERLDAGEGVTIPADPAHWSCLLGQYLRLAVWRPYWSPAVHSEYRGPAVA